MRLWIFCFLIFLNSSWAEVGRVIKVLGDKDAYLIRQQTKISLSPELLLELNDTIYSPNSYVVIHVYPGTQISLSTGTELKLSEHLIEENAELEKAFSVIDFIKGIIRLQVIRDEKQEIDQKVQAEGVAFSVRGTEFEISAENNADVELDVFEGEVVVSSPYVQTFVPEIVKAKEGFKFNRKQKNFLRRKFGPKFKNHPGFENRTKIRQGWKAIKLSRKLNRDVNQNKPQKMIRKELRREKRRSRTQSP